MNKYNLQVLQTFFTVLALVAGVIAAWFKLRDAWQTPEDRAMTRASYAAKWRTIQNRRLLELPEKVIEWTIDSSAKFSRRVVKLVGAIYFTENKFLDETQSILAGVIFASCPFAGYLTFGKWGAILTCALTAIVSILYVGHWMLKRKGQEIGFMAMERGMVLGMGLSMLLAGVLWLKFALALSLYLVALVLLLVFPLYAFFFSVASGMIGFLFFNIDDDTSQLVGFSMSLSFLITIVSLSVGHTASPSSPLPKTMQMILSNVVFDGATVLATLLILRACVTKHMSVPTAILLDIAVAAFLACSSLFFGVVFSPLALTPAEVLNILLARSADNNRFELGPFFCSMHTTFLPTVLYSSIILLCWIGKILVLPLAKVLKRGEVVEKPHELSAITFALVAAVFAAAAATIKAIAE